jgi:hypothetical protein
MFFLLRQDVAEQERMNELVKAAPAWIFELRQEQSCR